MRLRPSCGSTLSSVDAAKAAERKCTWLPVACGCAASNRLEEYHLTLAIIPRLVPRELLMNGMALSSSAMNGTRIIAPAVGGLLIAPIGIGGGFAVLTAMYALSVVFTIGLPKVPPLRDDIQVTFFSDLADGFRFIRRDRLVLGLLLLGTVPMIFAMPYQTLMPVFASKVWHVGARGLGVLQAMSGVGGLAGTLITGNMDRFTGISKRRQTNATAQFCQE